MNLGLIFQYKKCRPLQRNIKEGKRELGQNIPLFINGEKIDKSDKFESLNPADTSQLIAKVSKAKKTM